MIAKISSRVLDVLFILSLIVALSGGSFLFSDSFRTLIQQKPWIHRLVVLIPTMFLFGFVLYEARLAKQKSFFFTAIERYKINSNRHWGLCILLFSFSALQGIYCLQPAIKSFKRLLIWPFLIKLSGPLFREIFFILQLKGASVF